MSKCLLKVCADCNTRGNTACAALSPSVTVSFGDYNSNSFSISITVAIAFLPYRGIVIVTLSSVATRDAP